MRLYLIILAAACLASPVAAQSIGSLDEISGIWTGQQYQNFPYEACSNVDSENRITIGRAVYDDKLGDFRFTEDAEPQILFYEGACGLGDAISSGGQLAMAGDCGSEGEEYDGIVTFERIDANTIKVKTPMNDEPIVLASCNVDFTKTPAIEPVAKLGYGSRAGMTVTITGQSAIDTSVARIYYKHTPDDARAFCMDYELSIEPECIERTMSENGFFSSSIGADCDSGMFDTVYGSKYRFSGPNFPRKEYDPEFSIYPAEGGEMLDGSSASGYGVALAAFSALCPSKVTSGQ